MEKKTRQQIFKEVKERLATKDYAEIHKLRAVKNVERLIVLGEQCLTEAEIYNYYEKVSQIMENDNFTYKAIGMLIDEKKYAGLTDSAKQRYILNIASLYLNLKKEYYKNEQ